jgi:hypothetical protein
MQSSARLYSVCLLHPLSAKINSAARENGCFGRVFVKGGGCVSVVVLSL